VWILAALLALLPASASAQLTSLGATVSGPARSGINSAVAYDDKHDVFLQVWEDNGAAVGRFINFDGTPAGDSFVVAPTTWADWPMRVAYSHGTSDDVFAVLYSTGTTSSSTAYLQLVRYTGAGSTAGTLIGSAVVAAERSVGSDLIFNPLVRRFLVAYGYPIGSGVDASYLREFSSDGVAVGDRWALMNFCTGCSFYDRPMRLAVDWQENHCLLTKAYQGSKFADPTTGATIFERIDPEIGGPGISTTIASCVPPARVSVGAAGL
jgi:hypothetical protein